MKQPAYKLVDYAFKSFFNNNKILLRKLKTDRIYDLRDLDVSPKTHQTAYLCGRTILGELFDATYMGIRDVGETNEYIFFNGEFDKLYTYEDCE